MQGTSGYTFTEAIIYTQKHRKLSGIDRHRSFGSGYNNIIITTKDSYTWNITHNTESTAV